MAKREMKIILLLQRSVRNTGAVLNEGDNFATLLKNKSQCEVTLV